MRIALDNDLRGQIVASYRRLDSGKLALEEMRAMGLNISMGAIQSSLRRAGAPRKYRAQPGGAEREEILRMSKTMSFISIVQKTGFSELVVREAISTGNDKQMAELMRRNKTGRVN